MSRMNFVTIVVVLTRSSHLSLLSKEFVYMSRMNFVTFVVVLTRSSQLSLLSVTKERLPARECIIYLLPCGATKSKIFLSYKSSKEAKRL
jgi:hypothetical protein